MSDIEGPTMCGGLRPIHSPKVTNSFDDIAAALGLTPEQYASSAELRKWVKRHKNFKYVPLEVLELFGFDSQPEV